MSSSRKESERAKFVQEKCQTLLTVMLRDEDNKYCVDCDAKGKLRQTTYAVVQTNHTTNALEAFETKYSQKYHFN